MAEAADALGITVDAVRSRIKRGTIEHERVGGRVYVLLVADLVVVLVMTWARLVGDQ